MKSNVRFFLFCSTDMHTYLSSDAFRLRVKGGTNGSFSGGATGFQGGGGQKPLPPALPKCNPDYLYILRTQGPILKAKYFPRMYVCVCVCRPERKVNVWIASECFSVPF